MIIIKTFTSRNRVYFIVIFNGMHVNSYCRVLMVIKKKYIEWKAFNVLLWTIRTYHCANYLAIDLNSWALLKAAVKDF